ncbi:MAG: hypothetical protein ACM34K_03390 [Bacillota bacterium]
MKTAKRLTILTITLFAAILIWGCDINDMNNNVGPDYEKPDPPKGVTVLNGDNIVDIYWDANTERDIAGYNVYYSTSYGGQYKLLGSTKSTHFTDEGAKNGVTCYYAVAAYDYNDNESELSYEDAHATPRPEGYNKVIYDYRKFPNNSGYSFSTSKVLPYDDENADFFFENYQGIFYLDVWEDSDIQDMGRTQDIYDIPNAPVKGWSTTKDTLAIVGHTYVIWTWDNHFAKIRISNITNERVTFDWAYQTVEGNRELKTGRGIYGRSSHDLKELSRRLEKRLTTSQSK